MVSPDFFDQVFQDDGVRATVGSLVLQALVRLSKHTVDQVLIRRPVGFGHGDFPLGQDRLGPRLFRVDRRGAWIWVAYLSWVSFASVLNAAIWRLN